MKVKELIVKLLEHDMEADVILEISCNHTENFCQGEPKIVAENCVGKKKIVVLTDE